jgi:hypothetical protein
MSDIQQAGWFQGACYYQPDTGPASIMAAVGGHLFQMTPDASGNATITDLTIPGNPNPSGPTMAWLFQAENYLIWNDGVSVPVVFDGSTTWRTNNGQQTVLGVVSNAGFIVPAVGSTVDIPLNNPFAGTLGQVVLIGDATYKTVAAAGSQQANLTNLDDVPGTVYPVGTPIIFNPNVIFYGAASQYQSVWTANQNWPVNTPWCMSILGGYTGALGAEFVLSGVTFKVLGWVDANGNKYGSGTLPEAGTYSNPLVLFTNIQTVPTGWTVTISPYEAFYQSGSNLPVQTVGTLSAVFTVPADGDTAAASLTAAYTGAANLTVSLNGFVYTIIAANVVTTVGNTITAINENDEPTTSAVHVGDSVLSVPQLPTGRMGAYGLGRVWLSLPDGVSFVAGDIVGGASGTLQHNYRDAVLNVTENDYLYEGGAFRVPGNVGKINAMKFIALLDASLGQGPLQIFTGQDVFACQAPVDRTTWESLTSPILGESLKGSGGASQDAVSLSSGDILFRATDGTLRSLLMARLDFNRWGNTPISIEMQRLLTLENLGLLGWDSSVVFDNRLLVAALPVQAARGVYYTSIIALNFDPLSGLQGKDNSIWDGEWTALNVLKFISDPDGNAPFFNGVQRCFALCLSADLTQIELHEILPSASTVVYDDGDTPITSSFESPVLFGPAVNKAHDYLRLACGEIYMDGIVGPVNFQAFYKPDKWPNWVPWYSWTQTCTPNTDPGFRPRVGLPMPDGTVFDTVNNRPLREGFYFQFKLVGSGPFRFLGGKFSAEIIPQPEFALPVLPA